MIILGIDPGLSGALAFLDTSDNTIDVVDMPTVEVKEELQARFAKAHHGIGAEFD
jgi:Holliday junction resolvasome RuvABC endonuclease subunit